MDVICLKMEPIEQHQLELAEKAVAGDEDALSQYARNHGIFDWCGRVDRDSTIKSCKSRIEKAKSAEMAEIVRGG